MLSFEVIMLSTNSRIYQTLLRALRRLCIPNVTFIKL